MYTISKYVELDAAHRVPDHKSKCFKLHGHRYRVEAVCEGVTLHNVGEQKGMLLDFGFLKDVLMEYVHDVCDHKTIWYCDDVLLNPIFADARAVDIVNQVRMAACMDGCALSDTLGTVVVNFVPTAENLAQWWFEICAPRIEERSFGMAKLKTLIVYETPTSVATYSINPGAQSQS